MSAQATAPDARALLTGGVLAGEWALDPRNSSIRLKTKAMGLVPVNGVFREVSGTCTVSANGQVSGVVTITAASVDTKNARRDTHLRSADFFDSDNNPDITFAAHGVRPSGQGATVTGALTVRGATLPLSFEAAASVQGDDEVRFDAVVLINRADFGLTWNVMGLASMKNTLTIRATFVRR